MIAVEPDFDTSNDLYVLEFQGEFENVELFDGEFDQESLIIYFKGFYLQGELVEKELTIIDKEDKNNIKNIGTVQKVVLFKSPPRYIIKR